VREKERQKEMEMQVLMAQILKQARNSSRIFIKALPQPRLQEIVEILFTLILSI
jgi:hypothetical protein